VHQGATCTFPAPAGSAYELRSGKGCVCFEAKGETDVTLILKPTPGAKRWQPLARAASAGAGKCLQLDMLFYFHFLQISVTAQPGTCNSGPKQSSTVSADQVSIHPAVPVGPQPPAQVCAIVAPAGNAAPAAGVGAAVGAGGGILEAAAAIRARADGQGGQGAAQGNGGGGGGGGGVLQTPSATSGHVAAVEHNYTVILGSHR
jgi:hypothetical protein